MSQINTLAAAQAELKNNPDGMLTPDDTYQGEQFNEAMTPRLRQDFIARLSAKRSAFFWMGVLSLVAGVLAILFPFAATLSVNAFAAAILIVSGVTFAWTAFQQSGGAKWGQLGLGILSIVSGLVLGLFPLVGIFWLTLLLSAALLVEGVTTLVRAFRTKGEDGWVWIALSGALAIVVGLAVFVITPTIMGLTLLGLLLGINLLSAGIAQLVISRRLKPETLAKAFPDPRMPDPGPDQPSAPITVPS